MERTIMSSLFTELTTSEQETLYGGGCYCYCPKKEEEMEEKEEEKPMEKMDKMMEDMMGEMMDTKKFIIKIVFKH